MPSDVLQVLDFQLYMLHVAGQRTATFSLTLRASYLFLEHPVLELVHVQCGGVGCGVCYGPNATACETKLRPCTDLYFFFSVH